LLGQWTAGQRPSSTGLRYAIRQMVLDGRLPPGTRLPAERELADALGVSRTLVARACDGLREDGVMASRRGAGSWVALPDGQATPAPGGGWSPVAEAEAINFAQATPAAPPALFAAFDSARSRLADHLTQVCDLQGQLPLRELIAERFTARGLPTTQDQVLITSGAQHAFALTLRVLVAPGERVLVEHPTYPNALEAIRSRNMTPVAVPMIDGAWDAEAIEATLRQASPRLAYFIPDFQNPTGARMNAADRERIGNALRRTRTTAVVDETLVELDLSGREAPPPMAAFAEDQIVVVGSASKAYWTGLRLGWIRAPEEFVRRLVLGRAATDLGSPVFEQLVLAELLADPDAVLISRRREAIERRDALATALSEHCPQWSFGVPDGGLALWCDLGRPVSSRLVVAAGQHGVRLAAGAHFAVHGSLENYLRLPYTLPVDRLRDAVRKLARAAEQVGHSVDESAFNAPVT
jgi:DNA-binding transcriptional MocR family regulator